MRVVSLDNSLQEKYETFLLSVDHSLLFVSNKYRLFLREFLGDEDHYFIALDNEDKIVGALPAFLKKNTTFGSVLNSLPFYGSNGGFLEFNNNTDVRELLLQHFIKFAAQNSCVSTTIISSPLQSEESYYQNNILHNLKDSRIGQLSNLPDKSANTEEDLMKMYHYKTRNLVRKAQKLGVAVDHGNETWRMDFLISTHKENLAAIGGIAKPEDFFRLIPRHFNYGEDYRIYCALKEGVPIAALLVFYYNKTVEYYTPVIIAEHRSDQPMSLLIHEAMKDATNEGFMRWNWGGTWASQGGVYHFKSQWGTVDKSYFYYTNILDKNILGLSRETLLKEYPYFFVAPFSALVEKGADSIISK